MSEPSNWVTWTGAGIAGPLVIWIAKSLFSAAVRIEIAAMHAQNQERFQHLESALARIEGRLQERWGKSGDL